MTTSPHETIKQVQVELIGLGADDDGGFYAAVNGLSLGYLGPTKVYGSNQIALPNGGFEKSDRLVALVTERPFAMPRIMGFLAIASK